MRIIMHIAYTYVILLSIIYYLTFQFIDVIAIKRKLNKKNNIAELL